MTLETAQQIWKSLETKPDDIIKPRWFDIIRFFLLENFTKEELVLKNGFVWEDCWPLHGYAFSPQTGYVEIISGTHLLKVKKNRGVYKTEKQAESALAFAQLSHIVAKYNEGKQKLVYDSWIIIPMRHNGNKLRVEKVSNSFGQLEFNNINDAELSLVINKELWNQYWMV